MIGTKAVTFRYSYARRDHQRNLQMLRLASILYAVIATTLAGIGIIAVLVTGYDTLTPILVAAAIGALAALPASWSVARQLT
jgi:hypothetical protein